MKDRLLTCLIPFGSLLFYATSLAACDYEPTITTPKPPTPSPISTRTLASTPLPTSTLFPTYTPGAAPIDTEVTQVPPPRTEIPFVQIPDEKFADMFDFIADESVSKGKIRDFLQKLDAGQDDIRQAYQNVIDALPPDSLGKLKVVLIDDSKHSPATASVLGESGCNGGITQITVNLSSFNTQTETTQNNGKAIAGNDPVHLVIHEINHFIALSQLINNGTITYNEAAAEAATFEQIGPEALSYLSQYRKNPKSVPPQIAERISFWEYWLRGLFMDHPNIPAEYIPTGGIMKDYSLFDFYLYTANRFGMSATQLQSQAAKSLRNKTCQNPEYLQPFGSDIIAAIQASHPEFKGDIYDLEAIYFASLLPQSTNPSNQPLAKEIILDYIVKMIEPVNTGTTELSMGQLSNSYRIAKIQSGTSVNFDTNLVAATTIDAFGNSVTFQNGSRSNGNPIVFVTRADSEDNKDIIVYFNGQQHTASHLDFQNPFTKNVVQRMNLAR